MLVLLEKSHFENRLEPIMRVTLGLHKGHGVHSWPHAALQHQPKEREQVLNALEYSIYLFVSIHENIEYHTIIRLVIYRTFTGTVLSKQLCTLVYFSVL